MPKTLIHNLKSYFYLGFSFSVTGVIYIGCWLSEGCVISGLCEKLFPLIESLKDIAYFSLP